MKIFVDMLFINMEVETISIDIEESMTLDSAKSKILEKSYIYPEEQIWFCNNTPIKNKVINWNTEERYSIIVSNKWYQFSIKTITNSIKLNKIPNAYLFTGIRGVGKTTTARIVAKSLNCKNGFENLCSDNLC